MLKTIQNLNDKKADLARRVLKLQEEAGELAEAYLNITSKNNKKNKSWEDVREEAIDCAIVAIDIAFSVNGSFYVEEDIYEQVQEVFARKLDKWKRSRDTGTDVIRQGGKIEQLDSIPPPGTLAYPRLPPREHDE